MTLLTTWPESGPETEVRRTSDPAEIAAALAPIGVRYEQWPIREDVPADADSDTVFAAYGPEIEKLNAEEGFTTVDVLGLHPSDDAVYPV
jgi:1,2-dihydroxy-3-keto-5-methylthiopentene dioxygenase